MGGRHLRDLLQHAHLLHVLRYARPAFHVMILSAHPSSELHLSLILRAYAR